MIEIPFVHCVDTEGPLNESDFDTWLRIKDICDINYEENFVSKVLEGKFDHIANSEKLKNMVSHKTMNYVRNSNEHSKMLDEIFSSKFRKKTCDSFGGNYKFSWFVMDHVDYLINDRDKMMGHHKIFDIFLNRISPHNIWEDSLEFHFHSNPPSYHSSHSNTFWLRDNKIYNVVLKRLIDRNFFPLINRPGFHSVSPDSHWFQEMYIPFEIANQSLASNRNERFSDWSRAPKTWEGYNPSHDDYQVPGNCKRKIYACLNVGTRHSLIDEDSILFAIEEAKEGKKPVLAVANHDFRQMEEDTIYLNELLNKVFKKEKNVKFRYCNARQALGLQTLVDNFKYEFSGEKKNILKILSKRKIFGPSPFFGYKTKEGKYIFDNLTVIRPNKEWLYEFDEQNCCLANLDKISIAANEINGIQNITTIEID